MLRLKYPTKGKIVGGTYDFIIDHYPLASWHDMNKGRFHLFGHVHLPPHQKLMVGRSMDVGMDGNNMQPYKITEIVHMMDRREIGSDMSNDHHMDDLVGVVG